MSTENTAPNAKRLLWAGFMAILAAGVGFAIRGGIKIPTGNKSDGTSSGSRSSAS